jgi:hypothetical protein
MRFSTVIFCHLTSFHFSPDNTSLFKRGGIVAVRGSNRMATGALPQKCKGYSPLGNRSAIPLLLFPDSMTWSIAPHPCRD